MDGLKIMQRKKVARHISQQTQNGDHTIIAEIDTTLHRVLDCTDYGFGSVSTVAFWLDCKQFATNSLTLRENLSL